MQASERTLTQEELEEKEQARLAALEAARLKRMKADAQTEGQEGDEEAAGSDDEGEGAGAAATGGVPQGGYAAKRARQQREAEQWDKRQRRKLEASGERSSHALCVAQLCGFVTTVVSTWLCLTVPVCRVTLTVLCGPSGPSDDT